MITTDTQTHARPTLGLVEFVALMALLTSLVALSIDALLPALTLIGDELDSKGPQQNHLLISLFFGGMAFGQLFFGPFADRFGRRSTVLLGATIFIVGTVVCLLSTTMETMIIGRLIQAFGVSGPRIASMAMIRDIYVGDHMAKVMSFIMMVFVLVPMLAPMIGQWLMHASGWRSILLFFIGVVGVSLIWLFWRQPETLAHDQRRSLQYAELTEAFVFICTHRQVMPYIIGIGCIFGAFLGYISASQTIYVGMYNLGEYFPYIFASLAFSIGCASLLNSQLVERFGMRPLCHAALAGHLLMSCLFVIVQWQFAGLAPIEWTIGLLFIDFFFVGILFGNINSLAMQPLGKVAGMGAAVLGSLSSVVAVPIAIIVDYFLRDNLMPIGYGFVLCALATISMFWFAQQSPQSSPSAKA